MTTKPLEEIVQGYSNQVKDLIEEHKKYKKKVWFIFKSATVQLKQLFIRKGCFWGVTWHLLTNNHWVSQNRNHAVMAFIACWLWQYRLWSFQTGGTKLERYLPKNQHTQRKILNFENWLNGEVLKIGHYFSKESYLKNDAINKC